MPLERALEEMGDSDDNATSWMNAKNKPNNGFASQKQVRILYSFMYLRD
jgi:hypothetical protein